MNPVILLGGTTSTGLSILKDPFSKNCVEHIFIHVRRGMFNRDEISYDAKVEFENGNTKGEQKIVAANMDELLVRTKEFIESLK